MLACLPVGVESHDYSHSSEPSFAMNSVAPPLVVASLPVVPIALAVLVVAAVVAVELVLTNRVLNAAPDEAEVDEADVAAETEAEAEAKVPDSPSVEETPSSQVSAVAYQNGSRSMSPGGLDAERQATLDDATEKTMAELFAQLGDRRLDGEQAERLAQAVAQEITQSVGDAAGSNVEERAGFEASLRDAVSLRLTGISV